MTTIDSLLIQIFLFVVVILALLLLILHQYLWHRRQMRVIEKTDLRMPEAELPTQIQSPYSIHQVLGIGVIVLAIGIGSLVEAISPWPLGGSAILIATGAITIGYSLLVKRAGSEQ